MRILARVNLYVPWHGAGAEVYLHSLLRELARRGHDVAVIARGAPRDTVVDGIPVYSRTSLVTGADVVITHLDDTREAQYVARDSHVPLVAIMHNHRQAAIYGHAHDHVTRLLIFNSQWTMENTRPLWMGAAVVFHPPVDQVDYVNAGHPGLGFVTLVNLQEAKGAGVLYDLAARMPDVAFAGVIGGYGQQIVHRHLPNVTIIDHTPPARMRDVYASTRILLMPSDYESFGRCAIEAAWAGVPTIAHPTGGLVEALGLDGAGIFAHRDQVDEWERVIRCLADPAAYAFHSRASRARAAQLAPDYDAVVAAIERVAA